MITFNLQFHPFDKILDVPSNADWKYTKYDNDIINLDDLEFKVNDYKIHKHVDITINSWRWGL